MINEPKQNFNFFRNKNHDEPQLTITVRLSGSDYEAWKTLEQLFKGKTNAFIIKTALKMLGLISALELHGKPVKVDASDVLDGNTTKGNIFDVLNFSKQDKPLAY